MLTYTGSRNLYGEFTRDASTANLTLGDTYINESIRTICALNSGNWWFLEDTKDIATVASQASYDIPAKFSRLIDAYITVGTTIYMPEYVASYERWKLVLAYNLGTSDVPSFFYVNKGNISFQPIPASNSNTITVRGRLGINDMNVADYTTGTIVTATNGSTAIVGNGTSWNSSMVGKFIRITATGAVKGGDNVWYEIESVTDATNLVLVKNYNGTSIATGTAAYIIGQASVIPEEFQIAPIYRATALFYQARNPELASTYWKLYDGGKEIGLTNQYGGIIGAMIEANQTKEGNYLPPFGSRVNTINPNYPQPIGVF